MLARHEGSQQNVWKLGCEDMSIFMTIDTFTEDIQAINLEGYHLSFLPPIRGSVMPTVFDLERYFPGRLYWKWALMEKYTVDESKQEELGAAGWEIIDHTAKPSDLLRLTSQLSLVLALAQPGGFATPKRGELALWVRSQDLLHAERYPVILVYEATQETPVNELVDLIPGTHAIVFQGDAVYRYEVSQLGDVGLNLLQRIIRGTQYASHTFLANEFHTDTTLKKSRQKKLQALHENLLAHFALAQTAAAQLSELYWQLHLQAAVKPVRPPHSLMDIPPAFRHANLYENGALIPATDGLEAVIRAMSDAHDGAKGWGRDHSKLPAYIHERATSTTAVTLRMDQHLTPENERAVAQQLWERVTTYSDNDSDVLLSMLAQVVAAGPDDQGGTWITSSAILDYRGIAQKRHEVESNGYRDAGHRPDDMRLIADCVGRLRDMHISVKTWREPRKPGGRRRKVTQESYLVLISDFLTQTEEERAETNEEAPLQIAWYYRPGSCLDVPVRKNAKVAWLLQQALRYDPYHEKWEKRLARYFMFQLRLNSAFGGTTIQRSIHDILQEAGLFSFINHNDPIRTRRQFEAAMRTLMEHGHISEWSEARYLAAMEKHPARGWLDMWLTQELEITAAPLLEDLVQDVLDQVHTQRLVAPKKQRKKRGEQQKE
jgi:hypothetical protein